MTVVTAGASRTGTAARPSRRLARQDSGRTTVVRPSAISWNNACPGYVATDLNGFHGTSTPAEGAKIAIRLATLPDDGPTGGLFDDAGNVPW
jgi:hypothetical protein